jgi:hypothetical protein
MQLLRRSRMWVLPAAVLGAAIVAAVTVVPAAVGSRADLPGVAQQPEYITLAPLSQTNFVGVQVTHTATITGLVASADRVGATVTFTILSGPNEGMTFTATTDENGSASFTYTSTKNEGTFTSPQGPLPDAGVDQIQATFVERSTGNVLGSNWVGQGWTKAAVGLAVPDRPVALVKLPGTSNFVGANEAQDLPPGTQIDISGRRGLTVQNYAGSAMTFIGVPDQVLSRFILVNGLRKANAPIRINLTGGKFGTCKSAGGASGRSLQVSDAKPKKKKVKPIRRLWGFGKGRYTTTGKYASATVVGTFWLVADYCNGTLIKVRSGKVRVRDFVKKKWVTVTSGHAYFARTK